MLGFTAVRGVMAGLSALLMLGFAQAASGQYPMWEITARAGALRNNVASDRTDPIVGASVSRYTAGGLGIGGSIDWSRGEYASTADAPTNFDLVYYGLDVDYSFPRTGRTRVALGSGVGAAWNTFDGFSIAGERLEGSQTNLMIPILGSVKFLNHATDPSWAIRFDVRDRMVFHGEEDVFLASGSDVSHNIQGTAGISYFLGGPKRHAEKTTPRPIMEPRPSNPGVVPADPDAGRRTALATIGERIFFDFDRSEIRPSDRETLQRKAEALRAYPEFRIAIEGHADERGTIDYNLALGERRAESARRYLADLGIDPSRMEVVSFGEERPLVAERNEAAWTQNRRDEFVVQSR